VSPTRELKRASSNERFQEVKQPAPIYGDFTGNKVYPHSAILPRKKYNAKLNTQQQQQLPKFGMSIENLVVPSSSIIRKLSDFSSSASESLSKVSTDLKRRAISTDKDRGRQPSLKEKSRIPVMLSPQIALKHYQTVNAVPIATLHHAN
ncbi:hypothetical protein Ciccas_011103, partial [Cichlidogyrus casuarinus]